MVVLGAPGAPKSSDRAMSSRAMIAETDRSIIYSKNSKIGPLIA